MPADVSGAEEGGGDLPYGSVHVAEPVAAVEVVGDQQLLLERAVGADGDNRRECGEAAEAGRAVVREPPLALLFQDVEHRDCVPQTAVHILARRNPPPPPRRTARIKLLIYFSISMFPNVREIMSTSSSSSDADSASSMAKTSSTLRVCGQHRIEGKGERRTNPGSVSMMIFRGAIFAQLVLREAGWW